MTINDLQNIQLDGIDSSDAPDFSDAFITYAENADGVPLSEEEIDSLDTDTVYAAVERRLY